MPLPAACLALVPEVVLSLCSFVSLAGDLLSNMALLEEIKVGCIWQFCTWRPLLTAFAPNSDNRIWRCATVAAAAAVAALCSCVVAPQGSAYQCKVVRSPGGLLSLQNFQEYQASLMLLLLQLLPATV